MSQYGKVLSTHQSAHVLGWALILLGGALVPSGVLLALLGAVVGPLKPGARTLAIAVGILLCLLGGGLLFLGHQLKHGKTFTLTERGVLVTTEQATRFYAYEKLEESFEFFKHGGIPVGIAFRGMGSQRWELVSARLSQYPLFRRQFLDYYLEARAAFLLDQLTRGGEIGFKIAMAATPLQRNVMSDPAQFADATHEHIRLNLSQLILTDRTIPLADIAAHEHAKGDIRLTLHDGPAHAIPYASVYEPELFLTMLDLAREGGDAPA